MGSKTITVLVPVYNMGKYLYTCFDSILAQTYKDFILLVVEDGSTDDSAAICDEYAVKDPRVQVIHTKNQGQGEARNTGLKNIFTDYVAMIDSDDCVNIHFLEYLMDIMQKTEADIVCPSFLDFSKDTEIDYRQDIPFSESDIILYSRDEAVEQLCLNYRPGIVTPQKLYRTKVLKDIRYATIGVNIDEWVIHWLILNCKSFAILQKEIYYYRNSPEGMTRNFSKKKISGVMAMIDRIHCLESAGYNRFLPILYARLHNLALLFYKRCKDNKLKGKELLKPYRKELRKAFAVGVKPRKDLYDRKQMLLHWSFGIHYGLFDFLSKVIHTD